MKRLIYITALAALLLSACSEEVEPTNANEPSTVESEVKEVVEDKQLTYYESETKPFIDDYVKTFDSTWNNIWVIVMDRAANNDISTQDAYTQITKVRDAYKQLSLTSKIPNKELNKENKKLAKEILDNLNMSAVNRQQAAEIAMEILETNSTAKTDKMNEKIQWSDNFMNEALNLYEELENNLSK